MNVTQLQKQFESGKAPKNLDRFYKGKLDEIINTNFKETIGEIILSLWLPWKGKWFYSNRNIGDNILPIYLIPFLKLRLGKGFQVKKEFGGVHAFTFKTSIERGLKDNIKVLRLDYNLPQNPPNVRAVVDELVEVGKNKYLGKAHIKEGKTFRTIAFFSLYKTN